MQHSAVCALVYVVFGNSVANTTNLHGNCIIDIARRDTVQRWLQIPLPEVIKRGLKMQGFHGYFSLNIKRNIHKWYFDTVTNPGRSQWPRGLRRRSAAARLLRLWVRIPPGGMDFCLVSVVCLQVEVSASGWSLVQRSPTACGASLCVI